MINALNKNNLLKTIISIIVLIFISCTDNNKSTLHLRKEGQNIGKIKQSKSDLLVGLSKAICYSGFREGQHPDRGSGAINPSYEETLEDLKILTTNSNFNLIRVYDSGENTETILRVIKENNLDLKVLLGIWIKAELSNHEGCGWLLEPIPNDVLVANKEQNLKEIERGIRLANSYSDIVTAVNVGNEALISWTDHLVDIDTMITYVKKVKSRILQPVTVADNFKFWADNGKKLADAVDFVSIHVYPLWEGQDIDSALSYSISNVEEVCKALPKSKLVITEVGWATIASEFGERANEDNQLRYYNEIMNWAKEMNITTFFFEAFDEPWKGDPNNPLGAEKHWGIFNVDRTPKKVMKELYSNL